ncbi:hypothetical protein BDV93DRAFT_558793 [Ceratobasidium sp. AG-I]|nr:hypothetical protein BDV93DRAFT_558793 [Ceratobasidium sp. AG-I]
MAYDIAQPDSLLWNVMQLVEEELRYISKRLHPNVAVLAGVLQGYDGLNGYVVVTEGIPIEQFVLQARSGAAWANCIQGLTSFENDFRGSSAENITVRTDGHVVVFPSYGFSPLLASPNLLVNYVPTLQWDDIDPELRFLHKVYMANYWRFGTRRLEQFVASCSGLGPGFTKLQVTYLAASSGLLPLLKNYSHTWFGIKCMPFPALRVGDFGLVTAPDREYSLDPPAWTFLDKSRYFKDQEFTISRVTYLTYSGTAPEVDGYPWLRFALVLLPKHYS